jgi:hypothetical protein
VREADWLRIRLGGRAADLLHALSITPGEDEQQSVPKSQAPPFRMK